MSKQQVKLFTSRLLKGQGAHAAGLGSAVSLFISCLVGLGCASAMRAAPEASPARRAEVSPARVDPAAKARVARDYGRLPLSFEANQGQSDAQVKFLSRGRGYQLFLTEDETVLSLKKSAVGSQPSAEKGSSPAPTPQHAAPDVLRMKLVGANAKAQLEGQEKLPGISNYFIGRDPKNWHTNVPTYRKVAARGV